ncbi:helix-turn-helix domain-containing protein [Prauserella muralis]|uniref:Transcriptional regulator n=1 Tax=Prauserella muralis TaxID=588067 RepID=A0A2V4ARE2_9PSEU|nr:helix-turn-helix domain-containing protein [Prauserella muralis]PXY22604.1 transcriptional regulator [Prauserella muralis]TWE28307.1 AraC family transcriptional regulator [Prauserella muralis]
MVRTTPGSRVLSTREVKRGESVDYWRHVVSDAFVPLQPVADSSEFEGEVRIDQLGTMVVSRVDAQRHEVHRTRALIAREERGYYKLGLQLRGHALLEQDGRETDLGPGDLALYDTDRPYRLAFREPTAMAVFMFPRPRLRLSPAGARLVLARRLAGDAEPASLLAPLFLRLVRGIDAGPPSAAMPLADAVLDLLSALLGEQACDDTEPEPSQDALLLRAKAFIDDNLGDPQLCPDAVAAALHVSTRYLQKLFAADGTGIASWIRGRRLEQCRRDLVRPGTLGRPVSAVGAAWGLPDAAHFSRVFKAAYGFSPREFRARALAAPAPYANRQEQFA